jgi:hypothetical protein
VKRGENVIFCIFSESYERLEGKKQERDSKEMTQEIKKKTEVLFRRKCGYVKQCKTMFDVGGLKNETGV